MTENYINSYKIPVLNQKPVSFQQNVSPSMQGVTSDELKQNVDNSYYANRVKASEDANQGAVLGSAVAFWYILNQLMDKFGPKCEGDYDKTILGKLGKLGDKFSQKTWVGKKLNNFMRWTDAKFYKLSKKSKIVYSLRNHSTKPEWSFAKTPGAGLHGFLAADTEHIFEQFLQPIANKTSMQGLSHKNWYQKLEQYGMKQADIEAFEKRLKGKTFGEKALALQQKELTLLGADSATVKNVYKAEGFEGLQKLAEQLKLNKLGFASKAEYTALKGKFLDNPKAVMTHLEYASKNMPELRVSIGRDTGVLGKARGHLFGRTASFGEYLNKYKAALGLGNKTKIGRFLPKALGWLSEGVSNRFAGGKLGVFMQAYLLGDMLVHAVKAPKGEKGKTFIERFANDFSLFIGMTAGIAVMHKVGGFKYAGLDTKGVEKYRKAVEIFNKNRDAGVYANKAAYKLAKSKIKGLLGTKNIKNPITKLLQKVGTIINMGNERIKPFKSAKKVNMNWLRTFGNANILGVPLRVIIPMFVVSPFLAKVITKGVHAIFGRPTHSVLDEGKEEETPKDVNAENSQPNGQETPNANTPPTPVDPNTYADTNLIKQTINGNPEAAQAIGNTELVTADGEPVRTYIPSPEAAVIKDKDETPAQEALLKADNAEQYIQETLKNMR